MSASFTYDDTVMNGDILGHITPSDALLYDYAIEAPTSEGFNGLDVDSEGRIVVADASALPQTVGSSVEITVIVKELDTCMNSSCPVTVSFEGEELAATMGTDVGSLGMSSTHTAPLQSELWASVGEDPATVLALARGHSQPTVTPGDAQPDFGLSVAGVEFTLQRAMFYVPDLSPFDPTHLILGVLVNEIRGSDQDTTFVYTTSAPSGPNFTADMHNWTLVDSTLTNDGTVKLTGLPMHAEFWIGALSTYDYDNLLPAYAVANTQNRMELAYSGADTVQFDNAEPPYRGPGVYNSPTYLGGTGCGISGRQCDDQGEYDTFVSDAIAEAVSCGGTLYWIQKSGETGTDIPNTVFDWIAQNPSKTHTWQ